MFLCRCTAVRRFPDGFSWLVFAIAAHQITRDPARITHYVARVRFLRIALVDFELRSPIPVPDLDAPPSPEGDRLKVPPFRQVAKPRRWLPQLALCVRDGAAGSSSRHLSSRGNHRPRRPRLLRVGALFHPSVLPRSRAGSGLTPFKVRSRLRPGGAAPCTGGSRVFTGSCERRSQPSAVYLFTASIVMALSQVLNALYSHPYDIHNFLSPFTASLDTSSFTAGSSSASARTPYNVADRLQKELRESATRLREMSARMRQDIELGTSAYPNLARRNGPKSARRRCSWTRGLLRRRSSGEPRWCATCSTACNAASKAAVDAGSSPICALIVLDDLGITAAIKDLAKDADANRHGGGFAARNSMTSETPPRPRAVPAHCRNASPT